MSEGQDWISVLPDEILHHILSFLTTKQSIQTCILSKRWIDLWKFTPVIDIQMATPYHETTPSERTFIHNTLTQHQAFKLHKFSLDFSYEALYAVANVQLQHYIEFAISRQFLAREYEVNNNGWKIFENLKVFAWFGPLGKECDLIALIDFLVHCPSLEKIEIDFRFSFSEEAGEHRPPFALERPFVENSGDGQPTVGFLDNVKKIIIHHFFGYKSEIEFIKHLMQKAVVLETLSLTYHRLEFGPEYVSRGYTSCPPKELVQEEIFSLSTASSNVHISFHDTYHKLGF
ncbi:putative F-box/FBD/LRR-repeat protein At1g66300 isoform X3 [Gossypium raimondii]|uniref:putative F-box/FBD/LRR-repeat protein At1g66300 isoform X3 n=1 Tax=Gossypium raimondii TaxID=29730 RepID=UPI00227A2755|nr:putative F-box/FBD/LRR-repeat protein At1g66300 isoform X3 [Gossypium raimondii]